MPASALQRWGRFAFAPKFTCAQTMANSDATMVLGHVIDFMATLTTLPRCPVPPGSGFALRRPYRHHPGRLDSFSGDGRPNSGPAGQTLTGGLARGMQGLSGPRGELTVIQWPS